MPKDDFKPRAGTNVYVKKEGKEAGPFYLVQIVGDKATLQGSTSFEAPLVDIIREQ
jgi:hypothetical protein